MPAPSYTVAVRALCEFAAKHGDLDLRFTPAPSAQQGIAGHRNVAARRGPGYLREVALSGAYRHLRVRGRADGFDPAAALLEEIKTFRGDADRMPANHRRLHWAQAKVYGWLACEQFGLAALNVSLVYFDIDHQRESLPLTERCSATELRAHFESLCERFIAWADRELAHRAQRDAALTALRFPHPAFRNGQRTLAEAVFNGARLGRCLLAQAPTGIGKTIATIFPLLKACPGQGLDKLFFVTAKNSGRALALHSLAALGPTGDAAAPALRVLELVARDKACEHPDKACHGDSCPLARGFYDRLPAARAAAVESGAPLTRETLRELALCHAVCPYYLGQELARWCDVVVGDYNHFFDAGALLHGLAQANGWRVALLVDEAHNLVERARGMYSAELGSAAFGALRAAAPAELKKPLDRLMRAWRRVSAAQTEPYVVHPQPPAGFVAALQDAVAALGRHLADSPVGADSRLLAFYFDALQFGRLLESFDNAHSLFDSTLDESRHGTTLCIRNVVPARFLKPRFAAVHSSVLFSATLAPQHFYADALGLPLDAGWLDVQAPFDAAQLAVHVVRDVSTRFRDRERSLAPIARLIAAQYHARPGNYLAYFSSFEYLERAADVFAAAFTDVPVWRQQRRMDDAQREAFVARFAPDGRGVGFAVLGGAFAEGIDLPGTRLIGALIATLGLPQFNAVNEELRRRLDAEFGAGYDYTYLYPGLRKVVQAAGRVIRTLSDRGSVHLIDDRFARPEVARLLPAWWRIEPGPARVSARGRAAEHQLLDPE